MNYNSVILVGVVALTAAWWLIHARRNYPGPKVMTLYIHEGQVLEAPVPLEGSPGGGGGLHHASSREEALGAEEKKNKTSKED